MALGLVTDLYELRMAASYLRHDMVAPATFSLFVRKLAPQRGFLVAAGLEDALDALEQLHLDADDLDYLAAQGFTQADLDVLAAMRFRGEVRAVPEGTVVLADEPILEVTAPIAEAQLAETILLNQITYQTAIASKAARCTLAAAGKISVVDFSLRRTHGIEAGLAVARLSAIAGFEATSNVEAARRFGLRPSGTMAHSYIEAFPSETLAFEAFARDHGEGTTFLVDTYDTLQGVRHAIEVIADKRPGARWSIRLDSGDLDALARGARRMLDEAGLYDVRIFASGGLDEHDIDRFVKRGVPIDAVGIGTKLGVAADSPGLDSAYKLVTYDSQPVMKLSVGKATLPGAKQVFHTDQPFRDVIGLHGERPVVEHAQLLLQPVMRYGQRCGTRPRGIAEARGRLAADLSALPEDAKAIDAPVAPVASHSHALETLAESVAVRARARHLGVAVEID